MNKYLGAYEFIKLCVRSWEHSTDELDRPVMNTQKQDNMNILKELVDKETPKKVKTATKEEYVETGYRNTCPNCGSYVGTKLQSYGVQYGIEENDYCCSCGQKLDWGNEDD